MSAKANRKPLRILEQAIAILAVLCLLPFAAAVRPARAEGGTFTLLVYMTGSNLESEGEAASADLQEMMDSLPAGGNVRILVQAGGSESWGLDISAEKSTRLEIRPGALEVISEANPCSMGDGQTFADFLQWGYTYAPADRYGLILWNHGAGPLLGVCFDEQYKDADGNMDSLSVEELESALQASPFRDEPLCFIGFDACLMCTVEIASLVSPYADYMVASQETEPATGWNYAFLRDIQARDSGDVWGRRIIASYAESLQGSTASATLACLDLRQAGTVTEALDALFGPLADAVTEETYAAFARCRADVKTLGSRTTYDYDLVDLADLLDAFSTGGLADGSALRSALDAFVVDFWSLNDSRTNGVSIYYPFDNKQKYIASWSAGYDRGSFSAPYRSFIRGISGYYLRDSLFSPDSEFQVMVRGNAGKQLLNVPLTEEDAAKLVRARMIVLEEVVPGYYRIVYYDDQRIRQTDRNVAAVYSGEALFITDPEGSILAGPVSYLPVEDGIALYGLLYYGDFSMLPVELVYQTDENGKLVLSQIVNFGGKQSQMILPSALDISKFKEFGIVSYGPQDAPVTSLDFRLYTSLFVVNLKTDGSWELSFRKVQDRYKRFAYIRMTDINGETVCSEVVEIPNSNYLNVAGSMELEGTDDLGVSLVSVDLVIGYDAGLLLTFDMHNRKDSTASVQLERVFLGEKSTAEAVAYAMALETDESCQFPVFIPLETLQKMNLPDEITGCTAVFTVDSAQFEAVFPLSMNASMLTAQGDFQGVRSIPLPLFGSDPDSP